MTRTYFETTRLNNTKNKIYASTTVKCIVNSMFLLSVCLTNLFDIFFTETLTVIINQNDIFHPKSFELWKIQQISQSHFGKFFANIFSLIFVSITLYNYDQKLYNWMSTHMFKALCGRSYPLILRFKFHILSLYFHLWTHGTFKLYTTNSNTTFHDVCNVYISLFTVHE